MLIEHYEQKIINSIIYFLNNTKYCGKTKLCKLLYFLDFLHFRETGRTITGLDYYAWDFGPVPKKLYNELDNPSSYLKESVFILKNEEKSFVQMKPKKAFDSKYFTKRELKILEEVAFIFKEAKAQDIVEASHLPNHPWEITIRNKGKDEKIDLMLSLDNTKRSLQVEEVLERIKDRQEISEAFDTERERIRNSLVP